MPTQEELLKSLGEVMVPGVLRDLKKMNLIRELKFADGKASITLTSAALSPGIQNWLKRKINDVIRALDGVNEVDVSFVDGKPKEVNEIDRIIAVMSGKGGVGKSLVASLAAVALRRRGWEVGILDADITGPSIPKMFGISARPEGSESGILPVSSRSGIEVMSINLLLPSEDEAVIWRGPLLSRAITQFWEDVVWGKLDCLVVDLPPGTADASLTVLQTLPVSGVIIVFTPQDLTAMVVRKAISMAKTMDKPVLGVIENMSYLYVAEVDKRIELFGKSRGKEMAQAAGAPLLGQLPIDPEVAKLCDAGDIERYNSDAFTAFSQALTKALPKAEK